MILFSVNVTHNSSDLAHLSVCHPKLIKEIHLITLPNADTREDSHPLCANSCCFVD